MARVEMIKPNRILLVVFMPFGSLNITAAELTFEPFATVGYEQYEAGLFDAFGDEVHVKPSYMRADIGAVIRWSSLYFELNAGTGESVDVNDSLGNTAGFNRSDFRFTAGYAYRDRYLVFAGFQSSATELEYTGNIAETLDYDSGGPYIGAGYRQPLAFGDLAFNAAYSSRSARVNSTRLLAGDMRPESDGSGFIIDAALNVPLSPPLGLKAGLNYQSFEYSDWKDFFGNPVPITTPEQLTAIRVGVYAAF
jgi:hypothetical protein